MLFRSHETTDFPNFSNALEHYFNNESILGKKESPYAKKISELKRIIEEQEASIKSLQSEEEEIRRKGEMVYNNYQLIKEILTEINKAKEKYSWEEIKDRLKGHKTIKELNSRDRKISIELN